MSRLLVLVVSLGFSLLELACSREASVSATESKNVKCADGAFATVLHHKRGPSDVTSVEWQCQKASFASMEVPPAGQRPHAIFKVLGTSDDTTPPATTPGPGTPIPTSPDPRVIPTVPDPGTTIPTIPDPRAIPTVPDPGTPIPSIPGAEPRPRARCESPRT